MAKISKEQTGQPADRTALGLALMGAAMFVIPMRDGIAKFMTDDLPVFVIAWGTYVAAAVVAVPIALKLHGKAAILPPGLRSQTARTLLLVGPMTIFFLSLRTVPLANAISAYFVAPFVAAALAPKVLGERLTLPIAIAVVGGFTGVLIVLQPKGDFDVNILWAVLAGVMFAFYLLATRLAARQAPPMAALAYQALLGALVLTPFALWSGLDGTAAFLGLFAAVIVGFFAFGDWPAMNTWIGIAVILMAGALVAIKRQ